MHVSYAAPGHIIRRTDLLYVDSSQVTKNDNYFYFYIFKVRFSFLFEHS